MALDGVYVVGATSASRSGDMPAGGHASGTVVSVLEGTLGGNVYHCTSDFGSDVVGQHTLTWTRIVQHEQEVKGVVDAAYIHGIVTEACPGNGGVLFRGTTSVPCPGSWRSGPGPRL